MKEVDSLFYDMRRKGRYMVINNRPPWVTQEFAESAVRKFGWLVPDGKTLSFSQFGTLIHTYRTVRKTLHKQYPLVPLADIQAVPLSMVLTRSALPSQMRTPDFMDEKYLASMEAWILSKAGVELEMIEDFKAAA